MKTTPEDRFDTALLAYESLGTRDAAVGHPRRTAEEFHLGTQWEWYRDGYAAAAERVRRRNEGRDPSREPDAERGWRTAATPKPKKARYQVDFDTCLTTIPPQYKCSRTGETLSEKEYWKLPLSPEAEAAVAGAAREAAEAEAEEERAVILSLQERQDTQKQRIESVEGVGRMQRADIAELNGRMHVIEKDNTEARPRLARIEDGLRKQAARLTHLEHFAQDTDDAQGCRTLPERLGHIEMTLAAAAPLDGITLAERLSGMEHEQQALVNRLAEADERWKTFVDTQCRENARVTTALKKTRKMAKNALRILIGKSSMTSLNPPLLDQFYEAANGMREFVRQHTGRLATHEEKERPADGKDGSIETLTNNAMRDRIRIAGVEEGVSAVETRMTAAEERLADLASGKVSWEQHNIGVGRLQETDKHTRERLDEVAEQVTKQVEAFNKVVTNYSQRLADLERKAEGLTSSEDRHSLSEMITGQRAEYEKLRDFANASVAEINLRVDNLNVRADQHLQRANQQDQRLEGLAENVRKRLALEVRADVGGAVPSHNATLPDGSIVSFIPKAKRDATGPITEEEEKVFLDNLKIGMPVADLVLLTGRGRTTITSYRDRFIADGKLERRDD